MVLIMYLNCLYCQFKYIIMGMTTRETGELRMTPPSPFLPDPEVGAVPDQAAGRMGPPARLTRKPGVSSLWTMDTRSTMLGKMPGGMSRQRVEVKERRTHRDELGAIRVGGKSRPPRLHKSNDHIRRDLGARKGARRDRRGPE